MTLTQLGYLVALADHGHFGRAAESCGVSQPTLSAQIAKLEAYLDAPLVVRGARASLTPMGEAVAARARRMLELAEEVKGVAQRGAGPLIGPFRLGIIPTLCPYFLPWALPALRARFPRLELVCSEVQTAEALAALRRRDMDAAVVADPGPGADPGAGVESQPLFDEPFLAAAPAGHRFAAQASVAPAQMAAERLLVLEEGHCLRDQALALCGAAAPDGAGTRATSLETLLGLVAVGEGVTLAPALAARGRDAPVMRPFDPPIGRRLMLAHARRGGRRGEMALLADAIRAAAPEGLRVVLPGPRPD